MPEPAYNTDHSNTRSDKSHCTKTQNRHRKQPYCTAVNVPICPFMTGLKRIEWKYKTLVTFKLTTVHGLNKNAGTLAQHASLKHEFLIWNRIDSSAFLRFQLSSWNSRHCIYKQFHLTLISIDFCLSFKTRLLRPDRLPSQLWRA